jgi:hypothetical protein
MSVCLWADIDTYLKAAVVTDMGVAGLYATLEVPTASVLVGEAFDPDHVTLPFVLIRGTDADLTGEFEGVDDSELRLFGLIYAYEFVALSESSSEAQAKADGQELFRRLLTLLRTRYALGGLQASDGEIVVQIQLTGGRVGVYGRSGTNAGKYLAGAELRFNVLTEI